MKPLIIDSHCHLHDEKYINDLEEVLVRSKDNNITHFVSIGCDIETIQRAKDLSDKYENIYFSAGFHPHEAKFLTKENYIILKNFAQDKKCRAIGECGLDYYYNHSNKEEQREAFVKQIDLSKELNLPLIIHLRDAFLDCIKIFDDHLSENQKVVIHCFSGSLEEARKFIKRGFFISISGIVTFKNPGDLLEVSKIVPINQLLIETDCPWLSPHPFRGKRNEPGFIIYTLEAICKARNEDINILAKSIYENTKNFFGI